MGKLKKIISIIVLILLLPVLIVNSVILINSYTKPDEIPSFMGWKPFIVLSGSMETEIKTGDIVVVKEVPIEDVKLNDFYWGLNTKFKLEVGLKNTIDPDYPEIIWFPQGVYIITCLIA